MDRYLRERKGRLALFVLLTVISLSLSSYTTMRQQVLIDHLVKMQDNIFWKDILILVIFTLLALALNISSGAIGESLLAKITGDMRCRVFAGLLRRNREQENTMETGKCISALTNDIATVRQSYLGMLTTVISLVAAMITSIVVMFIYQPLVAVIVILTGVLMLVIPMKTGKLMAGMQKERAKKLAQLTSILQELLKGFEVITSFGIAKLAYAKFESQNQQVVAQEEKTGICKSSIDGIAQLVGGLTGMFIVGLSGFFVMKGRMSIGEMAVFSTLKSNFSSSLQMLFRVMPMMKGAKPIVDHLNELADITREESGTKAVAFKDKIEVKNLKYTYGNAGSSTAVLKGINCIFEKGKKYAVVGENGSGKSTFCRLLAGYSKQYEGKIYYDSIELREFNSESISKMIAFLHQNVFLFDDSIRYNITLGEEFSEQALREAIHISGVEEFVNELEGGLEYRVGENGNHLSGGQCQRIALARALIRRTPILILDEGTSALDERVTKEIEERIMRMPELTLISITHDRSAEHLAIFDQVFRVEEGKL